MRVERLVIAAGDNAVTLELHPRLTVIAGVGRVERDALAGELLGALACARDGVHLEVAEDGGRRLAVFRPTGARPRIVDVDAARDVTREFCDPTGRPDLLHRHGLDLATARRQLRFGSADLHAASHGTELVRRLASADQSALWRAAEEVLVTDGALSAEAEAAGSGPEDAEMVEQVEARHRAVEAAQARHERIRRTTLAASGLATVGSAGALVVDQLGIAIAVVAVAVLSMLASVVTRNRKEAAMAAEEEALAATGAQSYLGFHLQRVNGMLSSEAARKRLMAAADEHRRAVAAWQELAGDVPVEWAIEHHEEIAAAARVRGDLRAHAHMAAEPPPDDDGSGDLAHALVARLGELRRLGGGNESLPILLDDPLAGLDRAAKPALLELLSHSSGSPQIVYLTDDEDVASWARLEALTGAVAIIEPDAEPSGVDRSSRPRLVEI